MLETPAATGEIVVVAAGDIACDPAMAKSASRCHQDEVASLIESLSPTAVLPLGDTQYEGGELANFVAVYQPSWGRFDAIAYPAVGNHEYLTPAAAGYFDYFGARAGDPNTGYFSFDLGGWHLIALNTNCGQAGGCEVGSPQYDWLVADLQAAGASCLLAYGHEPRFSSGEHGDTPALEPLWQALSAAGADLFLSGHDHNCERLIRMSPDGTPDPAQGIQQFVVGTGGRSFRGFTPSARTVVGNGDRFGALALTLTLTDGTYAWRFLDEAGNVFDSGAAACHPPPAEPPPNSPPTAVADAATTPAGTAVVVAVLDNDLDADGTGTPNSDLDPASLTIVTPPANGQAVPDPLTGTIVYTPDPGFAGDDPFSYQVADWAGALSNVATVTVTVGDPPPPPPEAVVTVTDVRYSWTGGRNENKHLHITVTVTDAVTGAPMEGVTVSATLIQTSGGGGSWDFVATTAADGTAIFKRNGAGDTASCYDLDVTSISGASWDGAQVDAQAPACRP